MAQVAGIEPAAYLPDGLKATKTIRVPEFSMYRGGILKEAAIAYETWGELNAERDNGILIFTGLSPSAHAASSALDPSEGWWEYMIGPGRPIDSNRYFVVCVNSLGSCFGSTGPNDINPETGKRYRLDFPELSVEDIALGGYRLMKSLDIYRWFAVVGASLGGMTALAFNVLFPDHLQAMACISAACQASSFAIAVRSLQREMVMNDPLWLEGNYADNARPQNGMSMARKLGITSYRSPAEWQQRFARQPSSQPRTMDDRQFQRHFAVEDYLDHNGRKFARQFDPNCYLYLSRAMDRFDLAAHGDDLQSALNHTGSDRNLIIGVESDMLFPLWQQQQLTRMLVNSGRETQFHALDSIQGHDAFLIDKERFGPPMAAFFA